MEFCFRFFIFYGFTSHIHDFDIDERETEDIIKLNPRYNKIISSSRNYIKKQSALDKIASAIKDNSSVSKLNGCVYYDTKTINKIRKTFEKISLVLNNI